MRAPLALAVVVTLGCSGTSSSGLAAAPPTDAGAGTGTTEPAPDGGVIVGPSPQSDAAIEPPRVVNEVFGHSATTLYRLDPTTKAVTVVGTFRGCGADVIDIAIDKNSVIYGTTFNSLARIDRATAQCTIVSQGSYPNSLSFVPEGTLDPNQEALVGYQGSTYVRIDTATGAVRTVGQLQGGYQSSGDIVSVIGGKTFLTVNGNGCGDCLLEVNPSTGDLVKNWGSVQNGAVYGLAYWGGTVFGFTNAGRLFSVDFVQNALRVTTIPIPNAPSSLSFYGAGSSTSVPVDVPR